MLVSRKVNVEKWDNPTLIEGWQTSPYWHYGKCGTMKELFQNEKHRIIKSISEKEIKD